MSDSSGTLETIGRHLALAVRPLRFAVADVASFKHFMYRMGWNVQSLPPAYAALASLIDDVVNALTAIEASSGGERLSRALALLEKVSALYQAIKTLGAAPDGVDAAAFLAEVPERLFELLLVDYLAAALHPVHDLLVTLGVVRSVAQTAGAGRPPYLRRQLDFDRLRDVIADPTSIPRSCSLRVRMGRDNFDTSHAVRPFAGSAGAYGSAGVFRLGADQPRPRLYGRRRAALVPEAHRAPDSRGRPTGRTRVHVAGSAGGRRSETGPHPPAGSCRRGLGLAWGDQPTR